MSTLEAHDESSLAAIEDRFRQSLEGMQAKAQARLRGLARYLTHRPVRSIGAAFLLGVAVARLLQKLD